MELRRHRNNNNKQTEITYDWTDIDSMPCRSPLLIGVFSLYQGDPRNGTQLDRYHKGHLRNNTVCIGIANMPRIGD